jgi:hypothetical protein
MVTMSPAIIQIIWGQCFPQCPISPLQGVGGLSFIPPFTHQGGLFIQKHNFICFVFASNSHSHIFIRTYTADTITVQPHVQNCTCIFVILNLYDIWMTLRTSVFFHFLKKRKKIKPLFKGTVQRDRSGRN